MFSIYVLGRKSVLGKTKPEILKTNKVYIYVKLLLVVKIAFLLFLNQSLE